jgi:hypothetical protein
MVLGVFMAASLKIHLRAKIMIKTDFESGVQRPIFLDKKGSRCEDVCDGISSIESEPDFWHHDHSIHNSGNGDTNTNNKSRVYHHFGARLTPIDSS